MPSHASYEASDHEPACNGDAGDERDSEAPYQTLTQDAQDNEAHVNGHASPAPNVHPPAHIHSLAVDRPDDADPGTPQSLWSTM